MNEKTNKGFKTHTFYAETECICVCIGDNFFGTFKTCSSVFKCPLLSCQINLLRPLLGKKIRCLFAVTPELKSYTAVPRHLVSVNGVK